MTITRDVTSFPDRVDALCLARGSSLPDQFADAAAGVADGLASHPPGLFSPFDVPDDIAVVLARLFATWALDEHIGTGRLRSDVSRLRVHYAAMARRNTPWVYSTFAPDEHAHGQPGLGRIVLDAPPRIRQHHVDAALDDVQHAHLLAAAEMGSASNTWAAGLSEPRRAAAAVRFVEYAHEAAAVRDRGKEAARIAPRYRHLRLITRAILHELRDDAWPAGDPVITPILGVYEDGGAPPSLDRGNLPAVTALIECAVELVGTYEARNLSIEVLVATALLLEHFIGLRADLVTLPPDGVLPGFAALPAQADPVLTAFRWALATTAPAESDGTRGAFLWGALAVADTLGGLADLASPDMARDALLFAARRSERRALTASVPQRVAAAT